MNVLWIVIDCLRYDACSINGYGRPTTEPIDQRLDTDFISFSDACTQSGFTLNVSTSMLTGTYPSTHGVMNWSDEFQGEIPAYGDLSAESELGPAEAIPGMNFFTEEWGLNQAFDQVHNLKNEKSQRECNQASATEICEKCKDIITDQETFNHLLWFFDAHTPWLSERQFEGQNAKRDRYDTEIQYVSEQLEDLFEHLEQQDRYDDTLILLTGDHGDVFDEYRRLPWGTAGNVASRVPGLRKLLLGDGYLGHLGRPFVEELVHVPLFVKLPSSEGGGTTISGQVELIDILPTILDAADETVPETVEGESLLSFTQEDAEGKDIVKAEMEPNPVSGLQRMTRGEQFKYITHESPSLSDANEVTDIPIYLARRFFTPGKVVVDRAAESENIAGEPSGAVKQLRAEMDEWEGTSTRVDFDDVSDGKRDELEKLGYL